MSDRVTTSTTKMLGEARRQSLLVRRRPSEREAIRFILGVAENLEPEPNQNPNRETENLEE
jgi:hypothetical protein